MLKRSWISDVKIERRAAHGRNITIFLDPPKDAGEPSYVGLVTLAGDVFRDAVVDEDTEYTMTHADVMAWSSLRSRGVQRPDRYRVTADFWPSWVPMEDEDHAQDD